MYKGNMMMDTLLKEHVPLNNSAVVNPDAYGIEVELEGVNIIPKNKLTFTNITNYWGTHADGSLRKLAPEDECLEYVSRRPFNLKETVAAIDLLFDYLNSPGVTVHDSYRTSIHVHVNCGMEPLRVIYNFITLCLILDELLVSQNGDHRIGNNFCLRAKDALGQVNSLITSIENGQCIFGMHSNERYASINFASLFKFGSIEFRSLECTTNKARLLYWVNTLGRIKDVSRGFSNPVEIISKYSQQGPVEFLNFILGPFAAKYLKVPEFDVMLHDGMRIAQDFAYCSDWTNRALPDNKLGLKKVKPMYQIDIEGLGGPAAEPWVNHEDDELDDAQVPYNQALGNIDWFQNNIPVKPAKDLPNAKLPVQYRPNYGKAYYLDNQNNWTINPNWNGAQ